MKDFTTVSPVICKCGYTLSESEAFCSRCGKVTPQLQAKKGVLLLRLDKIQTSNSLFIILGLGFCFAYLLPIPFQIIRYLLLGAGVAFVFLGVRIRKLYPQVLAQAQESAARLDGGGESPETVPACVFCGKRLAGDVAFCSNCGAQIGKR